MWADLDIATGILLQILFMGAWVLWKVQSNKNNDFNFEEMLRGDNGKPQAFRLAIFVQLAVSTWVMMYIVLKNNNIDTWIFALYLAVWSGAKVAESAIDAYAASKGVQKPEWNGYERRTNHGDSQQINTRRGRYDPPQRRSNTLDGNE